MLLFLMPVNIRSIMCLFYPLFLLFFHVLLVSILIRHCSADDCLQEGSAITDGTSKSTLVSPGGVFELGFFTPDGNNNNSRYVGIWYHNQSDPKIVVWVANRNNPLLESSGSFAVKFGNAVVLDAESRTHWSSEVDLSGNLDKISLCLQDTGNLVINNTRGERGNQIPWQSFDNPTDTFLPGMDRPTSASTLTSWETSSNPALGNYTFWMQIQDNKINNMGISKTGSQYYWESDVMSFNRPPQTLLDLLLKNDSESESYKNTRLVMKSSGQIQFWEWKSERGWFLNWSEPNDSCDLYQTCGNFGSCNSKNGLLCKCLPGFNPSSLNRWHSGNFSEGCSPRSNTCGREYSKDLFLRMPMMKVKLPDRFVTIQGNCTALCLGQCGCVAYSCGASNCTGTSNETCFIWKNELTDLQEEYHDGYTIFVRSSRSDLELTSRGCEPCGAYTIPYPLSTSADCGDRSYFNFHCNMETGQVTFSTSHGSFNVSSIDPETKRFSIQVSHGNQCDSRYASNILSPAGPLPFIVRKCNVTKRPSFLDVQQFFVEVEIGWKPPPEPACNASSDCRDWPLTTCKVARNGERRCLCRTKFHWDGYSMNCDRKVNFPLKVVVLCLASVLAIIILCGIFFIYQYRRGRLTEQQDSIEFKGDDAEGIDVPFFDWEIILATTSNFADSYKLGTGGFGSVYRGKLPDGQDIAVKRLSSVSVQGLEEFGTEVKLIAKLQHRNLVRLVGYCMKADEKILVYEYMPNGSLDSCLFEDEKHSVYLDWKQRFDIILGIARGLVYLHQDSRLRVIHRDLKPSNILLDEELIPKISDFGIARIVGGKETHASTIRVVGTYGYMSPEYASDGIFSVKSDVFSFGVVILETVSGRRNSKIFMFEHGLSLPGHAWKLWNEDKGLDLMDPKLNESCYPSEVLKCIHIGLLCVQEDPSDRPTMSTVVHMLSGENASLPLAKQPAFMNRKPLSENASTSSAKDSSLHEVMTVSTVGR